MKHLPRPKTEYGGFLPLELNSGREWFARYAPHVQRYNSVKAALLSLIHEQRIQRMFIPAYYCPSTISMLCRAVPKIYYYHINDALLPELPDDAFGSCILLVDYFGVRQKEIRAVASAYTRATVILDNAHSFFAEPLWGPSLYAVYSAKKFFGVPDGAYLVGRNIHGDGECFNSSYEYASYLFLSYENGTNAAYDDKKCTDLVLAQHPGPMSKLAHGLLCNVEYNRVIEQRIANFAHLWDAFSKINQISLSQIVPAYCFPALLYIGGGIKSWLIKNKIYVPTLWKPHPKAPAQNDFERHISENGLFLPIDQRYDVQDMSYITNEILRYLHEHT